MTGWTEAAHAGLRAGGVEFAAYLPDSKTQDLIEALEADSGIETVLVTREEAAVGVLVGAWVGGTPGALVCQSSGLMNSLNALASLSIPARVPFVGVVTRRGNLGEFNDAQVPGGYNLDRVLDDLGCRNDVVREPDTVEERVRMATETAFATGMPYVVLLDGPVVGRKAEAERGTGGPGGRADD